MAAKSLGTLTLDLIAKTGGFVNGMTAAERSSAKWKRKVEKDAKAVGKSIALAAGTAVAGLTAMVTMSIRNADASRKMAQSVGLSTEAMTGLAFAAKQSGVEQSQLFSAMGRLNRSMLDAAAGTGRQAEMFDALGISVTDAAGNLRNGEVVLKELADRFQTLPDGAQKSAVAMELLGRSGTQLIPLLNSGAIGIKSLTDRAAELGLVINDATARDAELFNDSLAELGAVATGAANQIAAGILPEMAKFVKELSNPATIAAAKDLASGVITALTSITSFISDVVGSARWMAESIAAITGGIAVGDIVRIEDRIAKLSKLIALESENVGASGIRKVKEYEAELRSLNQLLAISQDLAVGPRGAAPAAAPVTGAVSTGGLNLLTAEQKKAEASAEALTKSIEKQVAALEFQADFVHKTADELTLLKLAAQGATPAQLALAKSSLANIAAFEAQTEAEQKMLAERKRINEEAVGIAESLLTEEEALEASYERRKQIILDNTVFTGEAQQKLLLALDEDTNEKRLEINRGFWGNYLAAAEENLVSLDELSADLLDNLTGRFGDAFESMVFDAESLGDAVHGMAEGMLRAVVNALGQMAGQWIALQLVQKFSQSAAQASSANMQISNALAAQQLAALNAFASTAAIPVVGPGLAPAASAAAIAATSPFVAGVSGFALAGVAHDGLDSVPQTGTFLLEKGERVTTSETSAKLDKTLSDIQRNRSEGGAGGIRIVNAFDTGVIGDYLGSSDGERIVMNAVKRNQRTIRSLAG